MSNRIGKCPGLLSSDLGPSRSPARAKSRGSRPNPLVEAEKQHKFLAQIMDRKLSYTHRLITSLATEDFKQMASDAHELKRIGETTLIKISPSLEYVRFSTEFSSVIGEVEHRAKDHDLNGGDVVLHPAHDELRRLSQVCSGDKNVLGRNR